MSMNKTTLQRRVQDSSLSARDKQQLFSLISSAPDDADSLAALERRINATLGGSVKSYNTKVPKTFDTK